MYEEGQDGKSTLKEYEVNQKYMIVDGERFDFPYGINLRAFLQMNDTLFFTREHLDNEGRINKNGIYNVFFFHHDNAEYIDLGKPVGYYGYKFEFKILLFTCQKCGLKYHIIKTSPFRFRDKSKDNFQK